ncbi:MAG: NADPH-dependent F420 reductase [Acidobacteriota bacterium]
MRIGILGGTGIEGRGLALRFAGAGHPVVLGSRSLERAVSSAEACNSLLGRVAVQGVENSEALRQAEILFLAVPADQAAATLSLLRESIAPGTIVVDVTVPVKFTGGIPEHAPRAGPSNSEALAGYLPPGASLVGAFKTVPAHLLAEWDRELHCDVFVCGDSRAAKEKIMRVVGTIPSLRAVDAGPLRMARALEQMTVLAIWLNRRYETQESRYTIVGI